jgi:predicted nucleotidyltransferase
VQTSSVQSYLRLPLTHLLASGGHVRVLRALLRHGGPLSVSQLAADCGMSTRGVRNVLDTLVGQRAVKVLGPARGQLFAAAVEQPLVEALGELFEAESAHWESLQAQLREGLAHERHIRSAWLYGSVARATDEPRSDLDLAIAVDDDAPAVARHVRDAVQALGDSLGVHISPVVLTPSDLARLPPGDPWWAELLRDAKVLKGRTPAREAARGVKAAQTA